MDRSRSSEGVWSSALESESAISKILKSDVNFEKSYVDLFYFGLNFQIDGSRRLPIIGCGDLSQ